MALTLKAIRGRILDADSHEMIPNVFWGETFGPRGAAFASSVETLFAESARRRGNQQPEMPTGDIEAITPENVWEIKGYSAPSAIDINRREDVLDEMGIRRALIFPGMGIFAWVEAHGGGFTGFPIATPERQRIAHEALEAFTDWAAANANDRLRIPGLLVASKPGMTPELLAKEAEGLIKRGFKVLHIGTGEPPAGVGPADPSMDRFYSILTEANVSLVTHPPAGMNVMSAAWNKAAPMLCFQGQVHMAESNFVANMVLGGVFERHPTLRFGAIECGADWIGPLAERLDIRLDLEGGVMPTKLGMKPSEYINRNVRVSALGHEPVERWLERYPEVQDTYCFSTDFPHPEGAKHSLDKMFGRVSPLGDAVIEKFFFRNAELLMP